jgi:class 3 adenylate cyclase
LTERAVLVVEVADTGTLGQLGPTERTSLVETSAATFVAAVECHGGDGFAQRGSALYAGFPSVGHAIAVVSEIVGSSPAPSARFAIDHGDVEIHDSGEVSGPAARRSAGIVATAHPGQVLLSAGAHQSLLAEGESGWLVRSLGLHPIHGIDAPQQVFQLVLDGQDREFPPLLRDTAPPPLPMDRGAVAGYELRQPISTDLPGTTYRAYQPSVGREVVITVIDPAWANEAEFISRFEVETQLVTRLQHPHIVPVLDHWRDPTGAYLVAPAIGGSSLAEVLRVDDLAETQRRRLLRPLRRRTRPGAAPRRTPAGRRRGTFGLRQVVVGQSRTRPCGPGEARWTGPGAG